MRPAKVDAQLRQYDILVEAYDDEWKGHKFGSKVQSEHRDDEEPRQKVYRLKFANAGLAKIWLRFKITGEL